MPLNKKLLILLLALTPALALAAKPVKITPGPKKVDEATGETFRQYIVSCSNGIKVPIESWTTRKKWCLENGISMDDCWKKQIKAAKKACKGGKPKNVPEKPPA